MTVVLVRHAERDASGADAISPAGKVRARVLADMFRDAGVSSIFTSEFTRTKQTAAPLAAALGLSPTEIAADPSAARTQLLSSGGALAIVVGHSDSVPELIAELGGPTLEIKDDEFDRIFIVTMQESVATVAYRYKPAAGPAGGSKTLGTIIGAGAGALLGRAIDEGDIVCR
jgi:broad specificity phosphatase PhoE